MFPLGPILRLLL